MSPAVECPPGHFTPEPLTTILHTALIEEQIITNCNIELVGTVIRMYMVIIIISI